MHFITAEKCIVIGYAFYQQQAENITIELDCFLQIAYFQMDVTKANLRHC